MGDGIRVGGTVAMGVGEGIVAESEAVVGTMVGGSGEGVRLPLPQAVNINRPKKTTQDKTSLFPIFKLPSLSVMRVPVAHVTGY